MAHGCTAIDCVCDRRQLQVARDSAGLMSTVAKIRSTEIDPSQQAVGFDAVVNRIDRVNKLVDSVTHSKQSNKTMKVLKGK
jgi:predicted histidine transporter YuiF (NhaC family)